MQSLVAWCVTRGGAVAVMAFLGLIIGGWMAAKVPLDVFPEFVPVQVEIQTEAPGLSPDQVEQLVTRPVEAAVGGAPGLASMRSDSSPGISVVSLSFADNADPYKARQGIAERIGEIAATLPAGVGTPTLSPLVSSTMDLLKIGLVSDKLDGFALRDRAQWVLRPQLLAVPGVARITVYGGEERQMQIQPDLEKLASYGFTLNDLADAARAALALRGAGYVEARAQRVLIETPTPLPDPRALASAVVGVRNNQPVTLGDVALVGEGPALKVGDALIQGKPGILLSLSSQFGANTLETTRAVEEALDRLTPQLKADGIQVFPSMHRPANFIERALGDIQLSLIIAAGLILAVLFLFLRNWRSALISFLAIPLSLVAAAVVLGRMGETLNTMTLGGFAVALGVLVDDAIIGIENVLRRLRLNAESPTPLSRFDVVREATLEIRGPVLYATFVVLVAFVPVLVTSGVQGKFVGPLAIAFMASVVASLLVALTVTPALSALLLDADAAGAEPGWVTRLKNLQARLIAGVDRRLPLVGGVLLALFLLAAGSTLFLSGQFMPDFREGSFVIQVNSAVPGTSLADMAAVGRRISKELLAMPEVATAEQQLGRSQGGEDVFGTERSEFHVELKRDASGNQAEVQDKLRKLMAGYPGINAEVVTFLGDRVSESLTGETAAEVVNIYGDDLEAIDRTAAAIGDTLDKVEGVADLTVQHDAQTPAMTVELDPEALAAHGLKAQDALETLHTAYAGAVVGETYAGARKVDVVLILPEAQRSRIEQIALLPVSGPFGPVPLGDVARVEPAQGRFTIKHEEGRRRVSVTFNVKGRNLRAVVDDAKAKVVAAVKPEPGVTWAFTGQAEAGAAGAVELALYTALAMALIVMLLFLAFTRKSHPWLVLVNLPFSLIGSIFIIAVTGIGLTLGTLVGLATVFGIGARNAILLLAHYEHLVENEGAPWNDETVLRGASERLVPILMTAVVTALGLAPLAFGLHAPGQEVQGPMAVSVLGGLITSTVLNLIVLPGLAKRFSFPASRY